MRVSSNAAARLSFLVVAFILAGCSGGANVTPAAQGVSQSQAQPRTLQALPTGKKQCKDSGWQTFGVFKNQGDCVSYVASRGKNPPDLTPRVHWTAKAPMPTARAALSAAAGNGLLYAVGGTNGYVNFTLNEAYDPVSNTWSTKAPYPGPPICVAAAGFINGKLYVAGGWFNCDSNSTTNALAIYDPLTDHWAYGPSMPLATGDAAAAVVGGKLYVVGGRQGCGPCNGPFFTTVQAYDPVSNTWDSSRAPRPVGAFAAPGVEAGGSLYAIGGNTGATCCSTELDAYSALANAWTTKAPMPTGRYAHVAGAINGVIYSVGGFDTSSALAVNEAYDPLTNAWTTAAPMPTARGAAAAGVVSGTLYVVGGEQVGGIILATNEAFTP